MWTGRRSSHYACGYSHVLRAGHGGWAVPHTLTFYNLKLAFLSAAQVKTKRFMPPSEGQTRSSQTRWQSSSLIVFLPDDLWSCCGWFTFRAEDSSSSKTLTSAQPLRWEKYSVLAESKHLAPMCCRLIFAYANEICWWCKCICSVVWMSFIRSSVFIFSARSDCKVCFCTINDTWMFY